MESNSSSTIAEDVSKELQDYLTNKKLPDIFKDLMENILINKPDNPIDYITKYLAMKYPNDVKSPKNIDRNSSNYRIKIGSLSDDEDDADKVDSPIYKTPKVSNHRKTGVSAESMDPNVLKEQMQHITKIKKSPEVTETLLHVVSNSPLLRALDNEQKDMIVQAFNGPILIEKDTDIIIQGDIGDIFYLIESGSVDVYVEKQGLVHTYIAGDSFGELAIMYNTPRAATCRAKTNCKLWSLDRISFRCIVVAAALLKREMFIGFLHSVPLLNTLTELEKMTLADAMTEESFKDGDVICKQGDEGKYFYIIKDGEAICTIKGLSGNEKIVAALSTGNYFGEVSLLTSKPRQATVVAKGLLNVLSVDRATFTRILGSLDIILKRNMEEYKKFTAQTI
mmetsp:Transcript_24813/g.22532  ORF Transcript_24813/g.22532 Transcript_24813/m.22532 type:complete len:394 (-) Transcript_24813:29-1210(-)